MRAKRRTVTTGRPSGTKRTPTVRRIKPAIVSVAPRRHAAATAPELGVRDDRDEPAPNVDLTVDLGRGLVLTNPLVVAAGVLGYGTEAADDLPIDGFGAICTRGTTLRPRSGAPPPRMTAAPAGLLSAIGDHDPGVEAVVERHAPIWATWRVPVIVNLAAASTADLRELAHRLDGVPGIAAIELDLGLANGGRGGQAFAADARSVAAAVGAARAATDLPIIAKLSAVAADMRPIARAAVAAGADARAAIGTVPGLTVAPGRDRPSLGAGSGGLSGPAIRPIALRVVFEIAQVVSVPTIASGGVSTLADVLDFLAVGASAVAVGTAVLADPAMPIRLAEALAADCARRGLDSYRPLIGTALPSRARTRPRRGAG
jgi:dihydroorotate dehydrogenase (NAD+) catalytic subunit